MSIKDLSKVRKKIVIAAASVVGGLLLIYLCMVAYFNCHIFPGTRFDDVKLSGKSADGAEEELDGLLADYKLAITGRDGASEVINRDDIKLKYVLDGFGTKLIDAQNPFAWPAHLFRKNTIDEKFDVVYDADMLADKITSMKMTSEENMAEPVDAYISDYESGVGFKIVGEVIGSKLDMEKFEAAVKDALTNVQSELDADKAGCYIDPQVYSDDKKLVKQEKRLNKYTDTRLTYTFGDDTVVLDGDTIYKWMDIKKNGKVSLDEEKIREFVRGLGSKYDTIFRTRTFKTSYKKDVVINGGDYGWWMNREKEVSELKELIKKGTVADREPVYFQKAEKYGKDDYGDTYVEINLTAQHLFLYKDGKVVLESDFVSGKDTKDRKTPGGVFGITYKERDATLVGADYETPVSYWMPFNGSIGMHDATWRKKFGSNIYKSGGSHGCINLPFNVAARIYDEIEKNTPVICYYLAGTESTSITTQDDKEIAQFAVDAIDRIGEVKKERKTFLAKFLKRTRKCYNELSYNQKKYVTNIDKLTKAEKELKALD